MSIIGVVHSGIAVKDLEVSIKFYRDIFGLKVIREEPIKKSRADILGVPGAIVKVVIMGIPETDTRIELIQYYTPPSMFNYGCPVNAIGQVHIAFRVDDMEKTVETLKDHDVAFVSKNYELITDGPQTGLKWIYLKDPDGTNIELIQEPNIYIDGKNR